MVTEVIYLRSSFQFAFVLNRPYFSSLGLMNLKYTRLDLHKITDEEGTAMDKKKQSWKSKRILSKTIQNKELSSNYTGNSSFTHW